MGYEWREYYGEITYEEYHRNRGWEKQSTPLYRVISPEN